MNKLGLIPGGVDAVVIDMGLPDRRGDVLSRNKSASSLVPVVLATGASAKELDEVFKGEKA